MEIYVWENDGISDAYHDDGVLVVLAESPAQAREIVRAGRAEIVAHNAAIDEAKDAIFSRNPGAREAQLPPDDQQALRSLPERRYESDWWDGYDAALDRPPDRVLPLDKPAWIAFNGGGYD